MDLLKEDYARILAEYGPEAKILESLRGQIASAERRKDNFRGENPCVMRRGPSTRSY